MGGPKIRHGAIGSGRVVAADDSIRQDFANRYGIIAMDMEFDTVRDGKNNNNNNNNNNDDDNP